MLLLLDFGNTRLKYFIGEANTICESGRFNTADLWDELQALQQKYPALSQAVASDVSGVLSSAAWNKHMQLPLLMVDAAKLQLPFSTRYTTVHTLGQDRVALLAGAQEHYPNTDLLLIDMGSCITYDVLESGKRYVGGAISPGWRMRVEAMHEFTSKLPSLQPSEPMTVLGDTTASCMQIGAYNGVLGELQELIRAYRKRFEDLTVILTGGDAEIFGKRLKNCIFAHSNFLLEGLHELLEYNSIR